MTTRTVLITCALIAFAAGCILHYNRGCYLDSNRQYHAVGSDDAYISYRYAWNLVEHGTLSWNASGYRHTEGFTNPLWVYVSALTALAKNKDAMYPLTGMISVMTTALLSLFLLSRIIRAAGNHLAAGNGMVIFLLSPVLWLHATSGLESAVFGMVIAIVAYLMLEQTKTDTLVISALTVVAVWLRSDGFVYMGIVVVAAFLRRSPCRFHIAGTLLLSFTALLVWRWLVFGTLFYPNTFVAKMNAGTVERIISGTRFFAKVFLLKGIWVFPALAMTGMIASRSGKLFPASVILVCWAGYFVYIGGDYFLERHLLGVIILSAALSADFWLTVFPTFDRWKRVLFAACILALISQPIWLKDGRFLYAERKVHDPLIMLGKAIAGHRTMFGVLVSAPAGKIPFFADGDCIDPIGLNDPELARIQAPVFQPGHSSGSMSTALGIAHRKGRCSFFTFFPCRAADNRNYPLDEREQIALWIDNEDPFGDVRTEVPASLWEKVSKGMTVNWSVIAWPSLNDRAGVVKE